MKASDTKKIESKEKVHINSNTKEEEGEKEGWFRPWTSRAILWLLLATALMMALEFPFVFFFDTNLTNVGFMYVYFWMLPQAIILYFVAFKLRVQWSSTFILGMIATIGAPIDYYFDWVVQQNLIAPIFSILYIPLYIITGLSADISLMKLRPLSKPARASLISSTMLALITLGTTAFAAISFYPSNTNAILSSSAWLKVGMQFLIPYAIATGALGGYLGFCMARDFVYSKNQRTQKENGKNNDGAYTSKA